MGCLIRTLRRIDEVWEFPSLLVICVLSLFYTACSGSGVDRDAGESNGSPGGTSAPNILKDPPAPYPIAVVANAACALDGRIYVTGGWGLVDGEHNAVVCAYRYDPRENTWERLPDMPRARLFHACIAADGKVWVLGGMDDDSRNLPAVDCYDPAEGCWSTPTDLPTPRNRLGAAAIGELIHVVGGMDADGDSACVEILDTSNLKWRAGAPLPAASHGLAVAAVDGRVVATGGSSGLPDTWIFEGGAWREGGRAPETRLFAAAVGVGGRVYLLGDRARGDIPLLRYNLSADAWDKTDESSVQTHRTGAAGLDDFIYVIAGEDNVNGGELDSVSRYDVTTGKWVHSE